MNSEYKINIMAKGLENAHLHDIHDAIESTASFADVLLGVSGDGEFISILTTRELNVLEKIESVEIAQSVTPSELDILKCLQLFKIDAKSQRLISNGFSHGGQMFSLSLNAQSNWNALLTIHLAGMLAFPHNVTTKDDHIYVIADAVELVAFIGAAMGTVESHLESGRALKTATNNATTVEQLIAVVDNR